MKFSHRLTFVILLYCLVFLGLSAAQYWRWKHASSQYFNQLGLIQQNQIEAALELFSKPLKQMAGAYSTWQETVAFLSTRDRQWVKDYIDYPARNTYHIDALWIYDADYSPVYSMHYEAPEKELSLGLKGPVDYSEKSDVNHLYHFYRIIDGGLYEIWGAPMIGEATKWQTARAHGHFFVARHWNLEYLEKIRRLTQSEVKIDFNAGDPGAGQDPEPSGIRLNPVKYFKGLDDTPVARLTAQPREPDAVLASKTNWKGQWTYYFLLFVSGILVALVSVQTLSEQLKLKRQQELQLNSIKESLKTTLEERERLGRDMHDNVLQSVYALGLKVESLLAKEKDAPENLRDSLKAMKGQLNSIIEDLRVFLTRVEPDGASEINLEKALQNLIQSYRTTTDCQIELELDPGINQRLNPVQKNHLALIAKELISNAIRHAQPSKAVCRLKDWMDGVMLEVVNNGAPLAEGYENKGGRGLKNIRSRTEEMGGAFRIHSEPSNITSASLYAPIAKSE